MIQAIQMNPSRAADQGRQPVLLHRRLVIGNKFQPITFNEKAFHHCIKHREYCGLIDLTDDFSGEEEQCDEDMQAPEVVTDSR